MQKNNIQDNITKKYSMNNLALFTTTVLIEFLRQKQKGYPWKLEIEFFCWGRLIKGVGGGQEPSKNLFRKFWRRDLSKTAVVSGVNNCRLIKDFVQWKYEAIIALDTLWAQAHC